MFHIQHSAFILQHFFRTPSPALPRNTGGGSEAASRFTLPALSWIGSATRSSSPPVPPPFAADTPCATAGYRTPGRSSAELSAPSIPSPFPAKPPALHQIHVA